MSDRDVPEIQVDYNLTNWRNWDRIASLAETCETHNESHCLNLGRGKQGDAIRAAGADLRGERLRCQSKGPIKLMTVSSILDSKSGCTVKCAIDDFSGSFLASVVGKGIEFCGRKRVLQ